MTLGTGVFLVTGCADSEPRTSLVREIPDPKNSLITRWRADQYALGSYSYYSTETLPGDREELGSSLGDRVFFAGEAISMSYPGTVHGALLSGRDTASEIEAVAAPGSEIAVIGAGASGLAAGRQLADAGHTVTIFEGRDRVGGRVRTDTSLGYAVDLGASWIHGIQGNPLTEIADSIDAPRVRTDYDAVTVYDSDGTEVTADTWSGLYEAARGADERNISLVDAIAEHADNGPESDVRYLNFAAVAAIEQEYAADVADLAAFALHEGEVFPGPDVLLGDGYLGLLETLTPGLRIELNVAVDTIDWSTDRPRLDIAGETHEFDHIVVTVPLGVLKAGHIAFAPELPNTKLDAVDRLGMGLLDKVYLEFPERFWDFSADTIGFVSQDRGRWAQWYDLTDLSGTPSIFCFHAGSVAEQIETLDDDAIVAEAMTVLRTIYER